MQKANHIFDEIAGAIRGACEAAETLHRIDEEERDALDDFEAHLRRLLKYPSLLKAPEAERLLRRVERLRELRNMSEYGALSVEVGRDMDALWRRLPK